MKTKNSPKDGNLRVWHIPQVPGRPFIVEVETPHIAKQIINLLAEYDLFQFKHRIKPDYTNASGLEVFEGGEWTEWYSEDCENIDEFAN